MYRVNLFYIHTYTASVFKVANLKLLFLSYINNLSLFFEQRQNFIMSVLKFTVCSLPALTLQLAHAPAHQYLDFVFQDGKFQILNMHISWRNLIVTHEHHVQERVLTYIYKLESLEVLMCLQQQE